MGIVLPRERLNTSCFYVRTKKMYDKRLLNQNCEQELGNCKNCRIGDCVSEKFLLKLRNQGISIVNKNINFDLNLN